MPLQYSILDAFTVSPFSGNQAAVIVLPSTFDADAAFMLKVAQEFNLSETAYLRKEETKAGEEDGERYGLKWFTPAVEINLCGHATLASASVLFSQSPSLTKLYFSTLSGTLTAVKDTETGKIELDFPADETVLQKVQEVDRKRIEDGAHFATDGKCGEVLGVAKSSNMGYIVEIGKEVDLKSLKVNTDSLTKYTDGTLILTQASSDLSSSDINSRCFFPALGIAEDPVTGSAHCAIAPYWLGVKSARSRLLSSAFVREETREIKAQQVSPRGGAMDVVWRDGRCKLRGEAVVVMKGELMI